MDGALPSPPAARLVRRARLAPARVGGGPALRFALEDALRTAEFQDCGRLLLVRRLCLRGLPPQASPAQLARALEQAWRELATQALPASHPQAGAAPAVFFNSRFEARLAWLQRLADPAAATGAGSGSDLDCDWYWRAALPELAALPAAAAASSAPVLLVLLHEQEAALVQALRRWTDAALLRLDPQLTPALAERLLSAVDRVRAAAAARVEIQVSSVAHRPMATSAISKRWPPWLQRLRQPLGEQPPEPIEAVQRSGAARPVARPAATKPGPAGAPSSATDRGGGVASPVQERGDQGPEAPSSRDATMPGPASAALHQAFLASDADVRRAVALPWLAEASFSTRGGLLLLLNLLQGLGFERQARAEPGCVDALFLSLLDDAEPDLHDDVPRDVQTELFDACHAGSHLRLSRLWTLRLRRALRGHARMDLAELLQRPAWVSASPTHIDVVYALDSVDLRLRRLGLDSDPGWLPWFGRIVAFHFIGAELLPPEPGHG